MALAESTISYFSRFVCTQFPRAPEQPAEVLEECRACTYCAVYSMKLNSTGCSFCPPLLRPFVLSSVLFFFSYSLSINIFFLYSLSLFLFPSFFHSLPFLTCSSSLSKCTVPFAHASIKLAPSFLSSASRLIALDPLGS